MVEALGTTQLVAGDIAVIVIYFVIVLGFGLVVSNIFKSICFNENCDIWIAFLLKFASSYSIDNMGLLPDTQNSGCACAGNAGNVLPVTAGKRSRHASRHVRDARAVMHVGIAN